MPWGWLLGFGALLLGLGPCFWVWGLASGFGALPLGFGALLLRLGALILRLGALLLRLGAWGHVGPGPCGTRSHVGPEAMWDPAPCHIVWAGNKHWGSRR